MTLDDEKATAAAFTLKNPGLARLGFDGVKLYPDWAYVAVGAVIVLFVCMR